MAEKNENIRRLIEQNKIMGDMIDTKDLQLGQAQDEALEEKDELRKQVSKL